MGRTNICIENIRKMWLYIISLFAQIQYTQYVWSVINAHCYSMGRATVVGTLLHVTMCRVTIRHITIRHVTTIRVTICHVTIRRVRIIV